MARTVLIVDDDHTIRQALIRLLHRMGFQTEEAQSGTEALQKIRRRHYDLITMDVSMADLDGIDTVGVIRTETDVPIVVISAYLTEDIRGDLKDRSVSYFLSKPFSTRDLQDIVKRAISGR